MVELIIVVLYALISKLPFTKMKVGKSISFDIFFVVFGSRKFEWKTIKKEKEKKIKMYKIYLQSIKRLVLFVPCRQGGNF